MYPKAVVLKGMSGKNYIQAIKQVRAITGTGLAESKKIVDDAFKFRSNSYEVSLVVNYDAKALRTTATPLISISNNENVIVTLFNNNKSFAAGKEVGLESGLSVKIDPKYKNDTFVPVNWQRHKDPSKKGRKFHNGSHEFELLACYDSERIIAQMSDALNTDRYQLKTQKHGDWIAVKIHKKKGAKKTVDQKI